MKVRSGGEKLLPFHTRELDCWRALFLKWAGKRCTFRISFRQGVKIAGFGLDLKRIHLFLI